MPRIATRPRPRRLRQRCAAGLAWLLAFGLCPQAWPQPASLPTQPEAATAPLAKSGWHFDHEAVAAANPLAAAAGAQMLREGGSAIDAAVAVQMVLSLVEPQSSGLGGGAFLMLWDGRQLQAWDGRETAPAAASPGLFLRSDGHPMGLREAIPGGRSVGVPGVLRMLEQAQRLHGRLPWARLFEPAIALAEDGFAISPRLHALLGDSPVLAADPAARAYFYQPAAADSSGPVPPTPQPWPVGHRLRNPALAEILRRIARQGSAAFYQGPVAAEMVRRVGGHRSNPGGLALADLEAYRALQREPICSDWKTLYRVCGFPPPSSGHLALMQILGLLDALPPLTAPALQGGLPSADWLHRYIEAARLAFADRALYVADPAFVGPPAGRWTSLLEPDYLRQRAALIGPRSMGLALAGKPGLRPAALGAQAEQVEHGTSHISIADAQGQALALTTSIESAFGSGLLVDGGTGLAGGFLLNNELTDFSFEPADAQGRPVANRVEPGKRPRSSMSPTLVFDRRDGLLLMSLGSPGGAVIIHYVAKTLIASLDWGLDLQQAVDLPNFGNFNGPSLVEAGRFPAATLQSLRGRGQTVIETDLSSGVQAIARPAAVVPAAGAGRASGVASGWYGAADPRREGVVDGR